MRKILIVEDDTLLNRTLGYNLVSDGYEITAAYNHKDAVSHLKETEFDVALLDINLPDGSGLDLCEEIRGRGQHTYIIFITANDKESDMLKGYEAGGADYVTKPFSVTVLCRKVAAVFANLEEHTLTTIISRIRKKIETDEHKYIKTAYGMGYQWIGGEQA